MARWVSLPGACSTAGNSRPGANKLPLLGSCEGCNACPQPTYSDGSSQHIFLKRHLLAPGLTSLHVAGGRPPGGLERRCQRGSMGTGDFAREDVNVLWHGISKGEPRPECASDVLVVLQEPPTMPTSRILSAETHADPAERGADRLRAHPAWPPVRCGGKLARPPPAPGRRAPAGSRPHCLHQLVGGCFGGVGGRGEEIALCRHRT